MSSANARRAEIQARIRAATGIDEAMIRRLVHGFYDRVRADAELGPIFAERIAEGDWPAHLERMVAFWSSVVLLSGQYHGRPMQAHAPLAIGPRHFARWLELFRGAARRLTPPPAAAHIIEAAERIAASLEAGLIPGPDARRLP